MNDFVTREMIILCGVYQTARLATDWIVLCEWFGFLSSLFLLAHVTLLSWYMDPQSTPAPPASVCSFVQSWMFDGPGVFLSLRTLLTQNPRPPQLLVVTADACSCGRACTRTVPWRHIRWAWRSLLPRLRRMRWISTCCRAQVWGLCWCCRSDWLTVWSS